MQKFINTCFTCGIFFHEGGLTMAAKVNTKIELQFADKAVNDEELVAQAKKAYGGKDIKNLDIYVKPEEGKAYFVVNNDVTGSFDL